MPWLVKSASGKKLLSKNGALLVGELDCKCCGCHDKNPCPAGQVCVDDECVDGCDDDHPCPPGQICLDGQCVDKPPPEGNCNECIDKDCHLLINGRDTSVPDSIVDEETGQPIESWGWGGFGWFWSKFENDLSYLVQVSWGCNPSGEITASVISSVSSVGAQRSTVWGWDTTVKQSAQGCPSEITLGDKVVTCGPSGCLKCADDDPIPCPDDVFWDQNAEPEEPELKFECADNL